MLGNVFLKFKFRGHSGSSQGPLGLHPNALPVSYIPLNILNRQSLLSLRVYIKLVRKRSFLASLWFFSLFCSENRLRVVQISFSTQRIVLTQGSCVPELNTVPLRFTVGYFHAQHGSLCSQKNLLGGSQLLLLVTMLILDSSPLDAQVDISGQFP